MLFFKQRSKESQVITELAALTAQTQTVKFSLRVSIGPNTGRALRWFNISINWAYSCHYSEMIGLSWPYPYIVFYYRVRTLGVSCVPIIIVNRLKKKTVISIRRSRVHNTQTARWAANSPCLFFLSYPVIQSIASFDLIAIGIRMQE